MDETKAQLAYSIHEGIIENEKIRRLLTHKNAELLSQMKDEKLYQIILGDENSDWAGYLGQIDLYYTRAQVYDLIRIYNAITKQLEVNADELIMIPKTRLIELLPILTKQNYKEWLAKAQTLLSKDFRIELRKHKGLLTEDDEHTHELTTYEQCNLCGHKHKKNG